MDNNQDISYIAKRYRKGLFATDAALKRVKPAGVSFPARARIAVIAGVVVVLGATASILIRNHYADQEPKPATTSQTVEIAPEAVSRVIDFENATLPTVVTKIKEIYGVDIVNLPDNAEDYTLSLHYEGNASDLVETINMTLDTEMKIEK